MTYSISNIVLICKNPKFSFLSYQTWKTHPRDFSVLQFISRALWTQSPLSSHFYFSHSSKSFWSSHQIKSIIEKEVHTKVAKASSSIFLLTVRDTVMLEGSTWVSADVWERPKDCECAGVTSEAILGTRYRLRLGWSGNQAGCWALVSENTFAFITPTSGRGAMTKAFWFLTWRYFYIYIRIIMYFSVYYYI